MCLTISSQGDNAYRFFQWFIILLAANVVWLLSIAIRMNLLGKGRHYWTFVKWCINNFVTILLFLIAFKVLSGSTSPFFQIFFTKETPFVISQESLAYIVFFSIALLNCCADVVLTASDYLGFDD